MTGLTYGSLFSGVGGLEMGVQSVLGGRTLWHSEIEPGASAVLAERWPDVPNYGDINMIDWVRVLRPHVLTGGSPCQDVSSAGKRAGMTEGTRSNLWVAMRDAIDALRPELVVWENVRGALSAKASSEVESREGRVGDRRGQPLRALGRVLGDLADLGYDAWWCGLRASDVGAPHQRFRVFVFATPTDAGDGARYREWARAELGEGSETASDSPHVGHERGWEAWIRWPGSTDSRDAPAHSSSDGRDEGWSESAGEFWRQDAPERGDASTSDTDMPGCGSVRRVDSQQCDVDGCCCPHRHGTQVEPEAWGDYADAIARWAAICGVCPPAATEIMESGRSKGKHRLSPEFASWMMGYPPGHVTGVPGVTRNAALRCIGNGVVPQQAAMATRLWLQFMQDRPW